MFRDKREKPMYSTVLFVLKGNDDSLSRKLSELRERGYQIKMMIPGSVINNPALILELPERDWTAVKEGNEHEQS